MFVHDIHNGFAAFKGPRNPRRVLEFGNNIHHAHTVVFSQDLFQRFGNDALVVRRNFDKFRKNQFESIDSAQIGRAFDENNVVFVEENLCQHGETLLGSCRYNQIFRRTVDSERGFHAFSDFFTKRIVPFRRTVLDRLTAFFSEDFHIYLFHIFDGEQFRSR